MIVTGIVLPESNFQLQYITTIIKQVIQVTRIIPWFQNDFPFWELSFATYIIVAMDHVFK